MLLSIEELRGRPVVTADGHVVGELASLSIDVAAWQIGTIRIKLRKEIADRLGAHRGVFRPATVDVSASQVQSVGDAVVLAVKASELGAPQAAAPTPEPTPQPAH